MQPLNPTFILVGLTRKNMHPELTSTVIHIIHECCKAGECRDSGRVKISADGVYARLEEMQLQRIIRLRFVLYTKALEQSPRIC